MRSLRISALFDQPENYLPVMMLSTSSSVSHMASAPIEVRLRMLRSTESSTIPSSEVTHLPSMASSEESRAVETPLVIELVFALADEGTEGNGDGQADHASAGNTYTHGILQDVSTQKDLYLLRTAAQFSVALAVHRATAIGSVNMGDRFLK